MRNWKRFSALCLAGTMITSIGLTGCGLKDLKNVVPNTEITKEKEETVETKEKEEEKEEKEEKTEEKTEEKKETKKKSSKVSANKEDFEFAINGNVLSLPCTIADLEDVGFKMDDKKKDLIMNPNYKDNDSLNYGDPDDYIYVVVSFYNDTEKPIKYSECKVDGISFYDRDEVNTYEIVGGLKIGSTMDEVKAVFGEPERSYFGDNGYASFDYELENEDSFIHEKYSFKFNNEIVTEIDMDR